MERKDVDMFAPHVSGMDDEELFAARKSILELLTHPGWVLVQEIIGRSVDVSTLNMRYGAVADHAKLARDIGFQAGMVSQKSVTRAVLEVANKREEKIAKQLETEVQS